MDPDKKSCLKAAVVWILVALILLIANITDGRQEEKPMGNFTIKEDELDNRAKTLDNYFKERGMPLFGSGEKFIAEADDHKLDWRLLAAIAVRESTGGKRMPAGSNNPFGWNSGNYKFNDFDEAIAYVSDKFENGKYYKGKKTEDILSTYNPPSINKNYPQEVIDIMEKIENQGQ